MEEDTERDLINIPVDWSSERNVSPKYANHILINHSEEMFTILFYDLQPPLFLGNQEEVASQLENLKVIKPECVGKIYLSPSALPSFIAVLQENYSKYTEKFSTGGES